GGGSGVVPGSAPAGGVCPPCRGSLSARCTSGRLFGWVARGAGLQGAQAELVRVPMADTTLMHAPEGLSPDVALLWGDVLPTGFYCADGARIEPHGVYVVLGCGPIGLAAVLAARARGAERLFAIDSLPERLALAVRFGATPLPLYAGVVDALQAASGGRGADAVLEAVGSPEASRLALSLVRPGGT